MSRAYLIDAVNKKITPYENTGLKSLQSAVNGYIEGAYELPNGDYLFVDEEGLLKNPKHFFYMKGNCQPNAGNGVLIGPEIDKGETYEQQDVQTSPEELQGMVTFLDHLDILARNDSRREDRMSTHRIIYIKCPYCACENLVEVDGLSGHAVASCYNDESRTPSCDRYFVVKWKFTLETEETEAKKIEGEEGRAL